MYEYMSIHIVSHVHIEKGGKRFGKIIRDRLFQFFHYIMEL